MADLPTGPDHERKDNYGAEYPEFFARFYDLIYHQMRDNVDNDYYLERIRETKGRILEVGVGTGRLFFQAFESNSDIYGIDISPPMLDILKSKLNPEHHFRITNQNIIDFSFDTKFDLIIAPFRVFMHLIQKSDQLKALDNVCSHLNAGGRFIFDLFVPDLRMLINGLENVVDFEGEYEPGKKVKRIVSTNPDIINQVTKISFSIEWNDGSTDYSREWKSVLRFFFRYELEHLLERSSFRNFEIHGDFAGNNLTSGSKEFIITCYK